MKTPIRNVVFYIKKYCTLEREQAAWVSATGVAASAECLEIVRECLIEAELWSAASSRNELTSAWDEWVFLLR